jgi:enoyl-CoA hydratase
MKVQDEMERESGAAIAVERRGAVTHIKLDFAEERGLRSEENYQRLIELFHGLGGDGVTRVVVLSTVGDDCAGSVPDVKRYSKSIQMDIGAKCGLDQAACDAIEGCAVPVIGAVDGIVSGIWLDVVLACHLRVVAVDTIFAFPVDFDFKPPVSRSAERLLRIMGARQNPGVWRNEVRIDVVAANHLGLVNVAVDPSNVLTEAWKLAGEISRLAPLAIRSCLAAVLKGTRLPIAEGLELEAKLFSELFSTEDVREGTTAFLEKRVSSFNGA